MPFSFIARGSCLPLHLLSSFIIFYPSSHPRAEPEPPALIFSSVLLCSNSPVTPGAWAEATPCDAGSALFQQLGMDPARVASQFMRCQGRRGGSCKVEMLIGQEMKGVPARQQDFFSSSQSNEEEEFSQSCLKCCRRWALPVAG